MYSPGYTGRRLLSRSLRVAGHPAKDTRLAIGAVIIQHKLCLSDKETIAQIEENPYLQYVVGPAGYQMRTPFAPSLLVDP